VTKSAFPTKKALSQAQRQLLELIQRYSFCEIKNLEVRGGEPVFDPAPQVTEVIKIGAGDDPRPEMNKKDFLLRAQIIELLEHINRVGDGRIAVIEVRHRLPFRLVVERSASGGVG
jgi:hypothetical protein